MQITRLHLFTAGLLAGLVSAAPYARRGVECYFDVPAASGETCESLASSWGISADEFVKINPGVACPSLEVGRSYCVVGDWTPGETTSSTQPPRTSTAATTTTSTTPVTTAQPSTTIPPATPSNSPTMPGAASNCNKWYRITSGDTCDVVATKNGITVAQLRTWNTEINPSCSNLWLDYYICTGVPGAVPAPTTTTTPPAPSNSPALPGAVSDCNKWYKIASGDTCDVVAGKNAITVAQLRRWNTQINSSTSSLIPSLCPPIVLVVWSWY